MQYLVTLKGLQTMLRTSFETDSVKILQEQDKFITVTCDISREKRCNDCLTTYLGREIQDVLEDYNMSL